MKETLKGVAVKIGTKVIKVIIRLVFELAALLTWVNNRNDK